MSVVRPLALISDAGHGLIELFEHEPNQVAASIPPGGPLLPPVLGRKRCCGNDLTSIRQ
jgi:hypothetical protein